MPPPRSILRYGWLSPSSLPTDGAVEQTRRALGPFQDRPQARVGIEGIRDPSVETSNRSRVAEEGRTKRRRSDSPPARARGTGSAMGFQQKVSFSHLNPPLSWVKEEVEAVKFSG